jgi:hypothetical protein
MKTKEKTYDVFISYGPSDKEIAADVAKSFRLNGVEPFTVEEVESGESISDAIWQALAESKALVAILPSNGPSPSMAVEIGGAQAWSKPIYLLASDSSAVRLPSALSNLRLVPPGGIEDVIRDIKQTADVFSDEDRKLIAEIYLENGTSVDNYFLDQRQLRKATDQFIRRSGRKVGGERLLREMLTMRKRGVLPRIVVKTTSGARRDPA